MLHHAILLLVEPDDFLDLVAREDIAERYSLPLILFLVFKVHYSVFSGPLVALERFSHFRMIWDLVSLIILGSLKVRLLKKIRPHRVLSPELRLQVQFPEFVLLPLTDALPCLGIQEQQEELEPETKHAEGQAAT